MAKRKVVESEKWKELKNYLAENLERYNHPKFAKLEQLIVDHFERYPNSRAMLFVEYRNTMQ